MKKLNVSSLSEHVRQCCTITVDDVFQHLLPAYGWSVTDHGVRNSGKKRYNIKGSKCVEMPEPIIRDRYAYRPGRADSSVCLVVHADTVLADLQYVYDVDNAVVISSELDDRLGLAILTDAIERKSVLSQCAMLVCDNEEIGQSTASIFADETLSKPNWLMEFDRRGSDVVCYDYENNTWSALLTHVGFTVGKGSFSDICKMGSLEVSGVNVGVGYHREHSTHCYACLHDTVAQVKRSEELVKLFGNVRLTHVPRYAKYGTHNAYSITSVKSISLPDNDDWWQYRKYVEPITPVKLMPTLAPLDQCLEVSADIDDKVYCKVCGIVCNVEHGDELEHEWCLDCITEICDDELVEPDKYTGIPIECTSCGEWCSGEYTLAQMPVCLTCRNDQDALMSAT